MAIWMAALLAAAASTQEGYRHPYFDQPAEGAGGSLILGARTGIWTGRDFKFEAVRTDSTQATSKSSSFFSAAVLGGLQFDDHIVLLGTFEGDFSSKISSQVYGGYLGWRERPAQRYGKGVPDEVLIYAGALVGHFEVQKSDFGDFDRGVGFGGGLSLGWSISRRATIQLHGEYRHLSFDYQRDVLTGDDKIGGNSVWIGGGIDFRF